MIQITSVSKRFEGKGKTVEALKEVSLTIEKCDIYGIIGFSGAGKSTLVRMINALERPTEGDVSIKGKNLAQLTKRQLREVRKEIGMIFQQFNLLESRSIYHNIAIPLILKGVHKKDIEKKVTQLLEFVELSDKRDAYPRQLSGGQKQRVGIARALATNPEILLCDEATSALDPKTTTSILKLLKKINQELGVTIVMITHEMSVIQQICNKVAVMEDGKVVEKGSVIEVFGNPKQEVTKNFVETVIHDTIPQSLLETIRNDHRNNEVIRMKFLGSNSKESILSNINKQFHIQTTILFATVSELERTVLGILIVQLVGSSEEIAKVKEYITQAKVEFERLVVA